MRLAVYMSIFLHFLRKLLRKCSSSEQIPPGFLPLFSPGDPVRLSVMLYLSEGRLQMYPGIDQFPPGTTRKQAYEALERLKGMEPEDIFGERSGVTEVMFSVVTGKLDWAHWNSFRAKYGIRSFRRIHEVVCAGKVGVAPHPKPE